MSDGHLYLCGGVDYVGDSHRSWYDATHKSVMLLSSSYIKMLPLETSVEPVTGVTSFTSAPKNITLYDFNESKVNDSNKEAVQEHNLPPTVLLKMSVDGQFIAIQRSDIEVQVVNRTTRVSYWILCRSKAGNRILRGGVIWNTHSFKASSSQDLFLVTKLGLEHHRVSFKRRNCILHRIVGLYVHDFWYAASQGVLLLSSGLRANEIVPFLLHGPNAEKLPKLVFSTSVSERHMRLVSLYGDMYAVYGDTHSMKILLYLVGRTKVTCVRSLNITLPPGTALEFSVVDNLLVCHSLDYDVSIFFDIMCDDNSNPFSAPLPISTKPPDPPLLKEEAYPAQPAVGNSEELDAADLKAVRGKNDLGRCEGVVLCSSRIPFDTTHKMSIEHSALFNVGSSSASQLASGRPLQQSQRAISAATRGEMKTIKYEAISTSFFQWRFHAPNFVERSYSVNGFQRVEIRKLQLNLTEICRTCEHNPAIFPFLLRRGDSDSVKVLVLRLVRNHIVEQQESLLSVTELLSIVQTMYGIPRHEENDEENASIGGSRFIHSSNDLGSDQFCDRVSLGCAKSRSSTRNTRGFLIIQQADFYHYVWKSILEDAHAFANSNLSVYIVEYIKNLQGSNVQVEKLTFLALAECFIANREPNKLYQFLHYHVLADSVELAELIVRSGKTYPALLQVGMDMYYRLREICPLLHTLLDIGQTERAIEIAWKNMGVSSCDASVISGVAFFDSLVKSVTSSKVSRSPFQVTQMLGSLLLFLNVWDPAVLKHSSSTSLSILATRAAVPFPDEMVSLNSRLKLRKGFGFQR